MLRLLLPPLMMVLPFIGKSTVYTTAQSGNWSSPSTWISGSPGSYWGSSDTVVISHAVTLNQSIGFHGRLELNADVTLSGSQSISLYNNASAYFQGAVSVSNFTLNFGSDVDVEAPFINWWKLYE